MSLLRTILILIVIYYVYQVVTRYILPALFSGYRDEKASGYSGERQKQKKQASKREGEVTIKYVPEKTAKKGSSNEDYVDYEEVKD